MKLLILFFTILSFSSPSYSQLLEQVMEGVESGTIKNPESQLNQIKTKNPEFLPARLYMMNRRVQKLDVPMTKKHARIGYKYSPQDSDFELQFYDKMIGNRLFAEAGLTSGTAYDSKTLYVEYSNNYLDTDWVKIFTQIENRTDSFGVTTQGLSLGVGHIMVLDKYSYLDTNISLGTLQNGFLPNYSVSNELFYGPGNSTYSFRLKYNSFNSSSATFISPHYRYDFDPLYIGIRGHLTLAEITPGYAAQYYFGYKDLRYKAELSYTHGQSIEDNLVTIKSNFSQWDAGFNYRINTITEIGFRIMDYKSDTMNQKGYFLNLLFEY